MLLLLITKKNSINELAIKLSEINNNAPKGDPVDIIHLCGINYSEERKKILLYILEFQHLKNRIDKVSKIRRICDPERLAL